MTPAPARFDAVMTVARFAFAESLRRRVFAVVLALTVVFLGLYGLGSYFAFKEAQGVATTAADLVDERTVTGSTVFGLAMFATLFLGAVLATFLTIGVVRGDAESGLLQPLVVRPLGRGAMLVSRYAGAALASAIYALSVYTVALAITWLTGDWTPDRIIVPGLALAGATAIIAAISVLASVFMASTAQGIAVFMIFGAGLVSGLLGQIGSALDSENLIEIADIATWALPFEALYQHGLYELTSEQVGITSALVELGPFGGAQQAAGGLLLWSVIYTGAVVAAAVWAFGRRDL